MSRAYRPIRKDAIAFLDAAIDAVHGRNVKALRRAQQDLCDFLAGQQLLQIVRYYEREHGLEPAPVRAQDAA